MKYDELVEKLLVTAMRSNHNREAADAITTLQAELEQCRKDAERYRWLRKNKFIWTTPVFLLEETKSYVAIEFNWHPSKDKKPTRESLDAAIDKAMESV